MAGSWREYPIPDGIDGKDKLTIVGETLVMQVQGRLYTMPVSAPAGTQPKALGRESGCMSFGSRDGKIASVHKGQVTLVNVASGQVTEVAAVKDAEQVEMTPDGAIYVASEGKLRKFVDGKEITQGWPRGVPGERMQFIDGYFYAHAWHGTIRRFDANMDPDPGVVLGGASGSFIGHLDQNSELSNGRGMAHLRGDLFAVSGFGGTMHLMQWQAEQKQMRLIRRIGEAPFCTGLALDREGSVWWHFGAWQWQDRPDAPIELGINSPEGDRPAGNAGRRPDGGGRVDVGKTRILLRVAQG